MRRSTPRSDSIIPTISSSLEMKGGAIAIVSAVKRSSNPASTRARRPLGGKIGAKAAESRDDLIEDQENAVTGADLTQALQRSHRRDDHSR